MKFQRNYYEIIGVPAIATQIDIKRKYREMARQFHPDLVADKTFAQTVFMQVNQAYRVLSNPERRALYDEALARLSTEEAERRLTLQALAEVDRKTREADIAVMNGDMSKARMLCEFVIGCDPRNAEALRILGDILAHSSDVPAAIRTYRNVLEISPSYVVEAKLRRLEALASPIVDERQPDGVDIDITTARIVKAHHLRRFLNLLR